MFYEFLFLYTFNTFVNNKIYIKYKLLLCKRGDVMEKKSAIDWIVFILLFIGGLNWGLIGLFDFNLVTEIFGIGTVTNIIYILVGLSALIWLFKYLKK